jgi:flagellar hook-basal body complex protein FliE
MAYPITSIRGVSLPDSVGPSKSSGTGGGDFGEVLDKVITQTEQSRRVASEKVEGFLNGKPEELHSVVIASQRAQLEFELLLEVRNKVVQAYQEIMRMQV